MAIKLLVFIGRDNDMKIVCPELSYKIMGCIFAVHNKLGPGYKEKHYQKAIADQLNKERLSYEEQVKVDIDKNKFMGTYYIDFVIEKKVILEIKATPRILRTHIFQVLQYLRETGIELGILAVFARNNVIYKRILRGF